MGVVAISALDSQDILRKDFPSRHDEYLCDKMKNQRQSMKITIPAEEMPAQLKKAAKSVNYILRYSMPKMKIDFFIEKVKKYVRTNSIIEITGIQENYI